MILENILPNTQTFEGYHPHMTLAYVKKGKGKKYAKKLDEEMELILNEGIYSDSEYKKEKFKLEKLKD